MAGALLKATALTPEFTVPLAAQPQKRRHISVEHAEMHGASLPRKMRRISQARCLDHFSRKTPNSLHRNTI